MVLFISIVELSLIDFPIFRTNFYNMPAALPVVNVMAREMEFVANERVHAKVTSKEKEVVQEIFMVIYGLPFERSDNGYTIPARSARRLSSSIASAISMAIPGAKVERGENELRITRNGETLAVINF